MPHQPSYQKRQKELNNLSRTELDKKLKKDLPFQYKKGLTKQKILDIFLIDYANKRLKRLSENKDLNKKIYEESLKKSTVADLKEMAFKLKIKGRSKMRKAELIKALTHKIA